jgi:hypothetical protein
VDENKLDSIVKEPRIFLYAVLTYLLQRNENTILPEIFYAFNVKDVVKFLDLFGGKTVYVPTSKEMMSTIREVVVAYLKYVEKKDNATICSELKITGWEMRYINIRIEKWSEFLRESGYMSVEDVAKFEKHFTKVKETVGGIHDGEGTGEQRSPDDTTGHVSPVQGQQSTTVS